MIMENSLVAYKRDIKNNSKIRRHMASLTSDFASGLIKISGAHNRKYNLSDFGKGMMMSATLKVSVGAYANGDRYDQRLEKGDWHISTPTDTWFNNALSSIDIQDALMQFEKIISEQLAILKKLNLIPKDGLTIAIDIHLIPRYDRNRGDELIKTRYKNGTKYFEGYITAQCVDNGAHLVLGVLPLYEKKNIHLAVDRIMQICQKYGIKIRLVLLDREFFTVGTISVLDRWDVGYLMPCRNTKGVADALEEFHKFKRPGISEYRIANKEESAPYTMIIARRTNAMKKIPNLPKEMYIGFATNRPNIDLAEYTHRWAIETGYSMIESIRPRIRSQKLNSRLVCFLYAVLLFVAWVMLNALMAFNNTMYRGRNRMTMTAMKIRILKAKFGQPKKPPDILHATLSIAPHSGELNMDMPELRA